MEVVGTPEGVNLGAVIMRISGGPSISCPMVALTCPGL